MGDDPRSDDGGDDRSDGPTGNQHGLQPHLRRQGGVQRDTAVAPADDRELPEQRDRNARGPWRIQRVSRRRDRRHPASRRAHLHGRHEGGRATQRPRSGRRCHRRRARSGDAGCDHHGLRRAAHLPQHVPIPGRRALTDCSCPWGVDRPTGTSQRGKELSPKAVKIRVFALCLASIIVALATYVGSAPSSVGSEARVPMSLSAEAIQTAASAAELTRLIGVFETRVKEHTDALDYLFLGKLYLQRARSSGDLGSYTQAGAALERSLALYPSDPDALAALARLRYATHDFAAAARLAKTILAADPAEITARAILGDASLELGDYGTASDIFNGLATRFPNAAAVNARLARLAFLRGDDDLARDLADRAQNEARDEGTFGADLAWYAHLRAP